MTRAGKWIGDHLILGIGLLVLLYMFVPIFVVVGMSFNEPAGRNSYEFNKFTLHNWANPCEPLGMCDSVVLSIQIGLLATPFAVVTGLTYNFLPFMVLPLYASLEKIDPRLMEAGEDLYASPFTTFRTVTLPLSMPGLVGGTLLTFIPAAGDYINAQLLGNTQTQMVGNVIQKLFDGGSYPEASALSVALMAVIVVLVLVYVKRAGTEELL